MDEYKEIIGWVLGTISTILALNKDWVARKLNLKRSQVDVLSSAEKLEATTLNNEERRMAIYQAMLDDLTLRHSIALDDIDAKFKVEVAKLQGEIDKLNLLTVNQQAFIAKQARSLKWYKDRFGDEAA